MTISPGSLAHVLPEVVVHEVDISRRLASAMRSSDRDSRRLTLASIGYGAGSPATNPPSLGPSSRNPVSR